MAFSSIEFSHIRKVIFKQRLADALGPDSVEQLVEAICNDESRLSPIQSQFLKEMCLLVFMSGYSDEQLPHYCYLSIKADAYVRMQKARRNKMPIDPTSFGVIRSTGETVGDAERYYMNLLFDFSEHGHTRRYID